MSAEETTLNGRGLDAEIAECVMGWRRVRGTFAGTHTWQPSGVMLVPGDFGSAPEWATEPVTYLENLPHYSTEIGAAMSAAERLMEERYCEFEINVRSGYILVYVWFEDYDGVRHCMAEQEAHHYTPGNLAATICRAALAALETPLETPADAGHPMPGEETP